jgi:tetratricopeptide (TPR) repeat protein
LSRAGALILLALLPAGLMAGEATVSLDPAASVSYPWLAIGSDPRISAMGEAGAAASQGVRSLGVNPAGLDLIGDPELFFNHNEWDSDFGIRQETLSYGARMGDGAAAASLQYVSLGTFDTLDSNGAQTGSSTESAFAGTLGYAMPFYGDRLRLGAAVTGSQETLGASGSTFFSAGAGLLYDIWPSLRLGLAASNVALSSLPEGHSPSQYRLGLDWMPWGQRLVLAGEYNLAQSADASERLGLDWMFYSNCHVRGGWRFSAAQDDPLDQGPSLGLGFRVGAFDLDYAYVPYSGFSQAQRIAATVTFSDAFFGSRVIIEGYGVSQSAKVQFDEGMAAYSRHEWYEAKVALESVLKIYPDFPDGAKIQDTLKAIAQKISEEKSKGMNAQERANYLKKVAEARAFVKKGDYARARESLAVVLEFDPNLKDASDLMQEIKTEMSGRADALRREAQAALEAGDLRGCVVHLRQIRTMDPFDNDSLERLKRLQPQILSEVKKLHRQGIDHYVTGDIEGAVRLWQAALDLDPADTQGVKRDLDKARKLMQLRAN